MYCFNADRFAVSFHYNNKTTELQHYSCEYLWDKSTFKQGLDPFVGGERADLSANYYRDILNSCWGYGQDYCYAAGTPSLPVIALVTSQHLEHNLLGASARQDLRQASRVAASNPFLLYPTCSCFCRSFWSSSSSLSFLCWYPRSPICFDLWCASQAVICSC